MAKNERNRSNNGESNESTGRTERQSPGQRERNALVIRTDMLPRFHKSAHGEGVASTSKVKRKKKPK